jgi:lysophospholipase L1-like esterase
MMLYLAIFVALAIGAVLFELACRRWLRRKNDYFVRRPYERVRMTLDRQALPSLAPEVWVETNADGERGDPAPSDPEGLYRVLVAGGSAAECGLLDQAATWPALLQASLNRRSSLAALGVRRVHVGNIGRSLTSCEAVLTMLERTLPRYEKLDLLIVMVGASDISEWLENGMPAVIPEGQITASEIFAEYPGLPISWSLRGLASRRIVSRLVSRWTSRVRHRENVGQHFSGLRRQRQDAAIWVDRLSDATPVLDHFEKFLRRIAALAQARGIRIVLARQPWLDRDLTPEEEKLTWSFAASPIDQGKVAPAYYTHAAIRPLLKACDRRAARVAASLGIEQIELTSAVPASFDYYYDYLHFTPAGARLVAQSIAPVVTGQKRTPETVSAPGGWKAELPAMNDVETSRIVWEPQKGR